MVKNSSIFDVNIHFINNFNCDSFIHIVNYVINYFNFINSSLIFDGRFQVMRNIYYFIYYIN